MNGIPPCIRRQEVEALWRFAISDDFAATAFLERCCFLQRMFLSCSTIGRSSLYSDVEGSHPLVQQPAKFEPLGLDI